MLYRTNSESHTQGLLKWTCPQSKREFLPHHHQDRDMEALFYLRFIIAVSTTWLLCKRHVWSESLCWIVYEIPQRCVFFISKSRFCCYNNHRRLNLQLFLLVNMSMSKSVTEYILKLQWIFRALESHKQNLSTFKMSVFSHWVECVLIEDNHAKIDPSVGRNTATQS